MQAYIKLNNSILDCGLSVNELKVAVCLYSCLYNNKNTVQIKQSTIAHKCKFKQVRTVSDIICRLQRKGIIEKVIRPHKANGHLGTYIYTLKRIVSKGYFKVKRYILDKLSAVQLRMYLFVCRAITKKNDMWNSFNDISHALQIGRNKVIEVINSLVRLGFIKKIKIKKKDGSYLDNHYSICDEPAKDDINRKMPEPPAKRLGQKEKIVYVNYNAIYLLCQVIEKNCFIYFDNGG